MTEKELNYNNWSKTPQQESPTNVTFSELEISQKETNK